jgi:hypothetical protein
VATIIVYLTENFKKNFILSHFIVATGWNKYPNTPWTLFVFNPKSGGKIRSTTIRSANLPTSMVPRSAPTPHSAAACVVAASRVCHGVAPSLTRGEKVTAGGGQKVATGKDTRANILPGIKGVFPGYVHEVSRASAAYADYTALGQSFHEVMAKLYCLLDGGRTGGGEVVGMDMHVPQPWQEIGPPAGRSPVPAAYREHDYSHELPQYVRAPRSRWLLPGDAAAHSQ